MSDRVARIGKMASWGISILVLGGFSNHVLAQSPLPKEEAVSPHSEVKVDAPHDPTAPREEEKEQEKAEDEAKCLDQRLLLALFRPLVERYPAEKERRDLTFKNLFTDGWHAGWKEPEEGPDDAPRIRLLRIQPAFWERELRFVYAFTFGADRREVDEQEIALELGLPISRRFQIELVPVAAGRRPKGESWEFGGGDLRVIPEVMLWETKDVSLSSG